MERFSPVFRNQPTRGWGNLPAATSPHGATTEDIIFLGPRGVLEGFRGSHGEDREPEPWGNPRTRAFMTMPLGQHH